MGHDQPISVTFNKKGDKEKLMSSKSKLPKGIFVNNEFPPHIKCNRDRLRPILKLAKSSTNYKDKCKMEGDSLIIDNIGYTVNNIGSLPDELAAYRAAQKEDNNHIIFHGEWSPYSNFHHSTFQINGQNYHSSEQWIPSQKALFFGDSYTTNLILKANTPCECKWLGYQINGYDHNWLKSNGYGLCLDRIREIHPKSSLPNVESYIS